MKKDKHKFQIVILPLKHDVNYNFEFEIEKDFFEEPLDFDFEGIKIQLDVTKKINMLFLNFYVAGLINANCDRCTNTINLNIMDDYSLIVKMVSNPDELNESESDPDIYYISFNSYDLDLHQWIKDFILLSIPSVKKCNDDGQGTNCNKSVLDKINTYKH